MSFIAALYTHGRVVTGCNHGDAFRKLTADEQDSGLVSGFLDVDSGKFVSDEYHVFYAKHLILVRHAEYEAGDDPPVCPAGLEAICRTADRLAHYDLSDYRGFTSPLRRCRQSADVLSERIHVPFEVEPDIREWTPDEPFDQFRCRIEGVLSHLPPKSLLVSHCDFILNAAYIATGESLSADSRIPTASLTVIHDDKIVCLGEPADANRSLSI